MDDVRYLVPVSTSRSTVMPPRPSPAAGRQLTSVRPSRAFSATLPRCCPRRLLGLAYQILVGRLLQPFLDVHLGHHHVLQLQHRFHRFLCRAQWGAHRTVYVRCFSRCFLAEEERSEFVHPRLNEGGRLPDAEHRPRACRRRSSSCRPFPRRHARRSRLSWLHPATPFFVCPAYTAPSGHKNKTGGPHHRGPPAWCRLWRRAASVNDAPRAVIPP